VIDLSHDADKRQRARLYETRGVAPVRNDRRIEAFPRSVFEEDRRPPLGAFDRDDALADDRRASGEERAEAPRIDNARASEKEAVIPD
jgi:hypothetical protein